MIENLIDVGLISLGSTKSYFSFSFFCCFSVFALIITISPGFYHLVWIFILSVKHFLNHVGSQHSEALFHFFNINLASARFLYHLTCVTGLVSHCGLRKKLSVSVIFLLIAAHPSIINKAIIQVVVLIIEVVANFRIILSLLLDFLLFISLGKMTSIFLNRSETILKLKAGYHRFDNVFKLEPVRAVLVIRRFIKALKVTAVTFSQRFLFLGIERSLFDCSIVNRLSRVN